MYSDTENGTDKINYNFLLKCLAVTLGVIAAVSFMGITLCSGIGIMIFETLFAISFTTLLVVGFALSVTADFTNNYSCTDNYSCNFFRGNEHIHYHPSVYNQHHHFH